MSVRISNPIVIRAGRTYGRVLTHDGRPADVGWFLYLGHGLHRADVGVGPEQDMLQLSLLLVNTLH